MLPGVERTAIVQPQGPIRPVIPNQEPAHLQGITGVRPVVAAVPIRDRGAIGQVAATPGPVIVQERAIPVRVIAQVAGVTAVPAVVQAAGVTAVPVVQAERATAVPVAPAGVEATAHQVAPAAPGVAPTAVQAALAVAPTAVQAALAAAHEAVAAGLQAEAPGDLAAGAKNQIQFPGRNKKFLPGLLQSLS